MHWSATWIQAVCILEDRCSNITLLLCQHLHQPLKAVHGLHLYCCFYTIDALVVDKLWDWNVARMKQPDDGIKWKVENSDKPIRQSIVTLSTVKLADISLFGSSKFVSWTVLWSLLCFLAMETAFLSRDRSAPGHLSSSFLHLRTQVTNV